MSERLEAPVDLHTHSNFSDGELSPTELIEYASNRGIAAIAITDHDTVDTYKDPALFAKADERGIEIVTGVEISSTVGVRKYHILGLCIDVMDTSLKSWLDQLHVNRNQYTRDVVSLIQGSGWAFSDEILKPDKVHTKAEISEEIVSNPSNLKRLKRAFGHHPTRGEFIEKFMNPGGEYYIPRVSPSPKEAVELIHAAGGLAFLAHPVAYMYEQGFSESDIKQTLDENDFDGLEAIYYYYHKSGGDREINKISLFTQIAEEKGLLISGGTDFHGSSPAVGNYLDIGYPGKQIYPTLGLLRIIQDEAKRRQGLDEFRGE